jgi:putative ABC transport system permease protein
LTDVHPPSLPRIPTAVLRALLPHAERAEVLGDLAAEYEERRRAGAIGARVWCWRQVARSVPALVRRSWWRGWTGFEPAANAMRPGGHPMEQWIVDARHAARRLVRRPLYAALSILTLAIGIGGTASIFGIARAVLFEPLPYRDEETVGMFWMPFSWNQQEFAYLRGRFPGFSEVAQYMTDELIMELGGGPSRLVPGISASSELFRVLGVGAALGSTFQATDDVQGANPVAVLSYGLWQDLGAERSIIGKTIRFDGVNRTIIGVMPRGFWFPSPTVRIWIPHPLNPEERVGNYALVGRVSQGNRLDRFDAPLTQLTAMLGERFTYPPQWDKTNDAWVKSARDVLVRPLRPAILATLAAMAMILVIAGANVAALMLGQVEGRATELAVRSALGATGRRLTAQLVCEALMLGLASGVTGAALAAASFRFVVGTLPLGAWAEAATLDWMVFTVAMVVAIGAALMISLIPAIALWRGRLREAIGSSRSSGVAGRGTRLENTLVVAEVALAVLMAAGAGVLVRSVNNLYAIDSGLEPSSVGVLDVVLPADLNIPERKTALRAIDTELRIVPGVRNVSVVQQLALRSGGWNSGIVVEGKPDLPVTTTFVRLVAPEHFQTLGIAIKRGRGFEVTDVPSGSVDSIESPVVINEALAKKYFEGEDPIGRRVNSGFGPALGRIIGVVDDVAEGALTGEPAAVRYVLFESVQFVSAVQTFVFRTDAGRSPEGLLPAATAAVKRGSPRSAISEATTMERVFARAVGPVRQIMTLVTMLTGVALLLCAIGVYGVISHFVARRQRDWGIRIALGLQPARVISGIVSRGTALVALGSVIGIALYAAQARFIATFMYGVSPVDAVSIVASVLALLLVGVFAALLPAARASRTDPAIVLREQ